jgi:DNA-binding transcriptional MocR family regulator
MFLWARHPAIADAAELSDRAAEHDILLGPGHLFSPTLNATPWMRFNVAYGEDDRVYAFLAAQRG